MEKPLPIETQRIQTSILASLEKICLLWFARHMPGWIKPDHLTALGLVAMLGAGASYFMTQQSSLFLFAVDFFIIINWFGDSLDGTLARFRNQERPRYGYYVDHVVDMFGLLFLFAGLALSEYISFVPASILLVILLMAGLNIALRTYSMGIFRLSKWGFGPTEFRLMVIIANAYIFISPTINISGKPVLFFDAAAIIASIILFLTLTISVIQNAVILYKEERI